MNQGSGFRIVVASVALCGLEVVAAAQIAPPAQQATAEKKLVNNTTSRVNPKVLTDLNNAGMKVTITADWAHWDVGKFGTDDQVIDQCEQAISVLSSLHEQPGWKEVLDKDIHKIDCRFDGTHQTSTQGDLYKDILPNMAKDVKVEGTSLVYHMHPSHTNVEQVIQIGVTRDLANVVIDGLTTLQRNAKGTLAAIPSEMKNLIQANQVCGSKVEADIDWAHLDFSKWPAGETAVAYCDGFGSDIQSYCELHNFGDWAGKKVLQDKLKKLECRFDGTHVCNNTHDNTAEMAKDVEIKGSSLIVHLNSSQCSTGAGLGALKKAFGQ